MSLAGGLEPESDGDNGYAETKNYSIQKAIKERLINSHEAYMHRTKEELTLSSYINKVILRRYLDREEMVKLLFPHFKCLGVQDNVKFVLDTRTNETYKVKMVENKLECIDDKDDRCDHVIYAHTGVEFPKLFQS